MTMNLAGIEILEPRSWSRPEASGALHCHYMLSINLLLARCDEVHVEKKIYLLFEVLVWS